MKYLVFAMLLAVPLVSLVLGFWPLLVGWGLVAVFLVGWLGAESAENSEVLTDG